jgi:Flp pilus assembly protein TadG
MRYHRESRFWRNTSGAIAASYALALPALIAVAAVGFDYARLAGMDSELQNAADQAALAAASQLNGQPDACVRASAAAVGLVANQTLLASGGGAVTIDPQTDCVNQTGSIRFYSKVETSGGVAVKTPATGYSDARFVEVFVNARKVDYALLPVIMPGQSADISGIALAGLGSALCKLPPLMMCNPNEIGDPDFDDDYRGHGFRLITVGGTTGSYIEGVFGFLETGAGGGASALSQALGRINPPGDCIAGDGVAPKSGANTNVFDAINTRFDIYANGLNQTCGNDGSLCPPSANSRKDLMKQNGNTCTISKNGWQEGPNPYRPTSTVNPLDPSVPLDPMGFPRDMCHAVSDTGDCIGERIGDGNWDHDAYFRSNTGSYPGGRPSAFPADSNPTRYEVYKYEYTKGNMGSQSVGNLTSSAAPICAPPGVAVGGADGADRRVASIAIINCSTADNGGQVGSSSTNIKVKKFVDVFLVEPSVNRGSGPTKRSDQNDLYIEVIGDTTNGGGANVGQVIRKDTPYLIE